MPAAQNPPGTAKAKPKAKAKSRPPRGRPFPKGTTGNPGGRPKGLARRTRELVGTDGDVLIKLWLQIAKSPKEATSDRLAATRLLAERGWGKPAAFVPIDEADPLGLNMEAYEGAFNELEEELTRVAARQSEADATESTGPEAQAQP